MRRIMFTVLLLPACSGDGDGNTDTTQTPFACDDVEKASLKQVDARDYPAGTAEAHKAYEALAGLWAADSSCDKDDVEIRLTTGDASQFTVVTRTWPSDIDCGCTDDPTFPPDSTYEVIGLHNRPNNTTSLDILISPFPDEAAGTEQLFVDTNVTIFAPGEPLSMRACSRVEPEVILGSEYETYDAFFRRTNIGTELEVVLTPAASGGGGDPVSCTYTNFRRIE